VVIYINGKEFAEYTSRVEQHGTDIQVMSKDAENLSTFVQGPVASGNTIPGLPKSTHVDQNNALGTGGPIDYFNRYV
jgi:hypothetical protein